MCLTVLDRPTQHTRKRIGYKVVTEVSEGSYRPIYSYDYGILFEIGKEVKAGGLDRLERVGISLTTYHPGFHIFLNKSDAIGWERHQMFGGHKVAKVSFRGVIASGREFPTPGPIVVAKYVTLKEIV
ncbi:hypothetical protein LCGC14_0383270 [marine sediment metagenome]|uniref:Uncharacterized protein n=1 Tax=marine sediment metagenome TaxID=412755 RepID=A0A0F9WAK3_9ZZZZ